MSSVICLLPSQHSGIGVAALDFLDVATGCGFGDDVDCRTLPLDLLGCTIELFLPELLDCVIPLTMVND